MHVVYKLTFTDRQGKNIKPFFYIGSKSNCEFIDGILIENHSKKKYFGSSRWAGYKQIVNDNHGSIKTEILYSSDDCSYPDLISKELEFQIAANVVENVEYFNLALAQQNSFGEPGYALYYHVDCPNKRVRLLSSNPKVISGEYIHINKGRSKSLEVIEKWKNDVARKTKSKEHKQKIGRTGLVMLKNAITGECKRVPKDELVNYSTNDWFNPFTLSVANLDSSGRPINKIKTNKKIRSCIINSKTYDSLERASREEFITRAVLKNRLKSEKWPTWKQV